jgi:uncharacterized protein (TIGR02757 family)
MKKELPEMKDFLEEAHDKYNRRDFIANDPISIPHLFSKKEDIEIAGFLTAIIAWGNRRSIIKNATSLMEMMDHSPHDFIISHSAKELKILEKFVHRTFNGKDLIFFICSLKNIYLKEGGLEKVFSKTKGHAGEKIVGFRKSFLKTDHLKRSEKHISDPSRNSSAKRLCMYLRWMVRKDKRGVDFGLWKNISPSELCLPLDVHTGNVSRTLGLLNRKQDDWKAVQEITSVLKTFDPKDPVKYDFALFGLGVEGKLK